MVSFNKTRAEQKRSDAIEKFLQEKKPISYTHSVLLNIGLAIIVVGLLLQRTSSNDGASSSSVSSSSSYFSSFLFGWNSGGSTGGKIIQHGRSGDCVQSFGKYRGHVYQQREAGFIGIPKCLVESKWMKVQQHTVMLPVTDKVIYDWLWIDYHDRINVLVEAEATTTTTTTTTRQTDKKFMVFEQTKYALEGRTSKAIIGGIIEPEEEPKQAAIREVQEEMGVKCENMHFLGRFRTDVNRGMGWVNSFLATNCSKRQTESKNSYFAKRSSSSSSGKANDEVGTADTERQDLRLLTLTELRQAAAKGEFLEVQWSNTVALALLHPELMN